MITIYILRKTEKLSGKTLLALRGQFKIQSSVNECKAKLKSETFEKCSILFKFKGNSAG
jgi:hypothetical protein